MSKFYVIGSINMDMIANIPHFPKPGETLIGENMHTSPGGKGANQAVALARLGASVKMFGKIGTDTLGNSYQEIFKKEQVDITHIETVSDVSTGMAFIEVETPTGQNRIVVIPGANGLVDISYIQKSIDHIKIQAQKNASETHIVLLQLEIPIKSVYYALSSLNNISNVIRIMDPAPVIPHLQEHSFYPYIDYITPNETETAYLTGITVNSENDAKEAGHILLEKGSTHVVIKAGEYGSYYISSNDFIFMPRHRGIQAVDTTAAGDTFNAGLAYSLGQQLTTAERLFFANKVAGLSTTHTGAQKAMPTLKETS